MSMNHPVGIFDSIINPQGIFETILEILTDASGVPIDVQSVRFSSREYPEDDH